LKTDGEKIPEPDSSLETRFVTVGRKLLLMAAGQTGASIASATFLWLSLRLSNQAATWVGGIVALLLLVRVWYFHTRGPKPVLAKYRIRKRFWRILVDEGKISEEAANTHPQSNLLTGCLGTHADPPVSLWHIDRLEFGDTLLACSDGLWHYFTPKELGAIVHALPPREASEMLVSKARQRARGSGDNLSLALVRISALK